MCHVESLEKDFYLNALGSFDHDFTHIKWGKDYFYIISCIVVQP